MLDGLWNFLPRRKDEQETEGKEATVIPNLGCRGCRGGCCGLSLPVESDGRENVKITAPTGSTPQEVLENSVSQIIGILNAPYGECNVDDLIGQTCEMIKSIGLPESGVSRLVLALCEKGKWGKAIGVARSAGRELDDNEAEIGFQACAKHGKLDEFLELAKATGKKPSDGAFVIAVKAVSNYCSQDIDWGALESIIALGAPGEAIEFAVALAARINSSKGDGNLGFGVKIAVAYGASDNAKNDLVRAACQTGLYGIVQETVKTLFNRGMDSAETAELARVMAAKVEEKRRWHEDDANCPED